MSFFYHFRNHRLRNNKGSIQINIHYLTEILHTHFMHWYSFDNSCIIYQNINTSKFSGNGCNHFFHFFFICHITEISSCMNSLCFICFKRFFHMFLASAVKRNLCPCSCQCFCDCKTNSICCPCYQRYFSFQ